MEANASENSVLSLSRNLGVFAAALLCVIAISLQVQVTLFATEGYLGLRINLTDLLVLPAGVVILGSLLLKKSRWPAWINARHFYIGAGLITLTLALATLNTWFVMGEISRWALLNKLAGWIILAAIMGLGGWLASNTRKVDVSRFLRWMISIALLILIVQIVLTTLQTIGYISRDSMIGHAVRFPIDGLMANRNAYAFFMAGIYIFTATFAVLNIRVVHPFITRMLFFLLPAFMVLNLSRAAILAMFFVFPVLIFLNRRQWRQWCLMGLFAILGSMAFFAATYGNHEKLYIFRFKPYEFAEKLKTSSQKPLSDVGSEIKYNGDKMRLTILEDTLSMVRDHPVFGSGLGSAMIYQKQKHGEFINVIDSTPLWILAEMGIAGFIIFALFYFYSVRNIHTAMMETEDDLFRAFRYATLFIIATFTIMCLFHEILYTRHLWFFIGVALALPFKTRQAV